MQRELVLTKKHPNFGVLSVIFLLTLFEFCVDWATPVGVMDWLWYFAPLLLSVQIGSRIFTYLLASVITVLIFMGWYLSPPGAEPQLALAWRCMGLCAFWVGAILLSERVRAERKRLDECRLNALILADQVDAVSRFKVDGTFIFANDFYCCYFGKKREDLIGQKWHPIVLTADFSVIEERLRELSPAKPVIIIENRVRNGTGELRWMQFVNRANFDATGRITEIQSVGRDVTERRQAEESLRESEQRFRQLAENIQEIFWLYEVDHDRIAYISPNYEKLWGRTCAAMYADPYDWAKAVHPDDLDRVLAAVEKQAKEIYHQEYRIVMPDGEIRWTRGRAFPIRDEAGRTYRIAGVHEDITHRRRMDEQFQRSQENYRNLAESSPDAIFIMDDRLQIQYINRTGALWIGKFPAEIVGRHYSEFFPKEIANEYGKLLRSVFESGRSLIRERKTIFQGREQWVETRILPLRNQQGEVTSVMGVSRDMTDQRRAEEDLKQREKWSREFIDVMRDGFFRVDFEGRILDVNAAYCRMTGYSREELLTMTVSQISLTDMQPGAVRKRIEKVVQTGGEHFETRHRCKDGSVIYLETLITYLKLDRQCILALMRDITERKKLEQEVLKISEHERQRIGYDLHDGLGQHLAGVAFKVKALEEALAAARSPESGQAKEIVSLVNHAITQTRVLARSLSPVEVEVKGLIPALENLATETRRNFSVECRFHCALRGAVFDFQTSMTFYRIAQESIHNAIRHGGAELVELEIGRAPDDRIFLQVRDNGKGFSPESSKSAGMGLRIMQYRTNSIGGELTVVSAPGKGTEICCLVTAGNVDG